jgi:hypothetical protein
VDTLLSKQGNFEAKISKPVYMSGTKGTLYLSSNGFEVVPDAITQHPFPVRNPADRRIERGWRDAKRQ